MRSKRVAIVASHVIQYQDPFFRELAAADSVDLTVLYCSRAGAETYLDREMRTELRWDIKTLAGYRYVFLRNFGFGRGYTRRINPGVIPAIVRGHYDAVALFLGWGTITSLLAIAACRMTGTPFLLYGDSSHPPVVKTLADRLRVSWVRTIFRLASGFLVSGRLNAAYYRHYGADGSRFFLLPWAVDNDRFIEGSALLPEERRSLREGAGIAADDMAVIFAAKLLPRKDPLTLLRAVAAMKSRDRVVVTFLGDGELRGELEAFAAANALRVRFPGFVNQHDLPRQYAIGDVFVLPSTYEPRGAVINEAMACGLPVIVTDKCGSIGDIVKDGDNAFVFPVGDSDALARLLARLASDPDLRRRMGQRSREIISDWNFETGVHGVIEALQSQCSPSS